MSKANTTPKSGETEGQETQGMTELEALRAELEEAKKLLETQSKFIEQQTAIIKQNAETFEKIKVSTAADTIAGQNAMKINEMMKEKTKVYYPANPFDPNKTHVPVQNPITGEVDKVKVGEWVEVTRAVAEILEHSAKADKLTLMLQQKEADDFEQETLNLEK